MDFKIFEVIAKSINEHAGSIIISNVVVILLLFLAGVNKLELITNIIFFVYLILFLLVWMLIVFIKINLVKPIFIMITINIIIKNLAISEKKIIDDLLSTYGSRSTELFELTKEMNQLVDKGVVLLTKVHNINGVTYVLWAFDQNFLKYYNSCSDD